MSPAVQTPRLETVLEYFDRLLTVADRELAERRAFEEPEDWADLQELSDQSHALLNAFGVQSTPLGVTEWLEQGSAS